MKYTVNKLNEAAMEAARARWDAVAKPLHSLGRLEDMIVRVAGIQETAEVRLAPRCALVFCADHGVVGEGVTQSGQEVTALVARSIAEGSGNVNLMARAAQADVFAVDMGMAADVDHPALIRRRIGRGTRDLAQGPAMTREEAIRALQTGVDLAGDMVSRGYRLIATGEMGIGNTTACAAMCCALLGLSPEEAVGRGAGLSDAGLARKREAVRRALAVNRPDPADPLDALAKLGGFEIAGMAGAFLGGMSHRAPVVIDGAISAAAALVAARLCPEARDFMLPSHLSREQAAKAFMEAMRLEPVIRADMALGEGTGAIALMPMLDMALAVYGGPHTFDRLGMAAYSPQGGAT
ncbi:MAG: nicotinate-nucleotide--dimethylbenzimidazole phosphoribosyltransferase [Clostridia bacterium]|nr:nicotinate-nucleotide--dimethylbenzimidazole phosphoribosyltransferase [Clostridia bacterium]